jgi:GNAT superfamily N-acetyltransferase
MGWGEYCSDLDAPALMVVIRTHTSISFTHGAHFGLAIFDHGTSTLRHIFVQPEGKGYGTWLLTLVEEEMEKRGCRYVTLYSVANQFYERNGFKRTFWSRVLGGSQYWKPLQHGGGDG